MSGLMLIALYSLATTPTVAVQKAFEKKFPNSTKLKWRKENPTEWEAEFTINKENISANFAIDGTWLETEREIKVAELPEAVRDAIQKQYPGWKITEADKTETAKTGTIYEADLKKGKEKNEVAYLENGMPVKE